MGEGEPWVCKVTPLSGGEDVLEGFRVILTAFLAAAAAVVVVAAATGFLVVVSVVAGFLVVVVVDVVFLVINGFGVVVVVVMVVVVVVVVVVGVGVVGVAVSPMLAVLPSGFSRPRTPLSPPSPGPVKIEASESPFTDSPLPDI